MNGYNNIYINLRIGNLIFKDLDIKNIKLNKNEIYFIKKLISCVYAAPNEELYFEEFEKIKFAGLVGFRNDRAEIGRYLKKFKEIGAFENSWYNIGRLRFTEKFIDGIHYQLSNKCYSLNNNESSFRRKLIGFINAKKKRSAKDWYQFYSSIDLTNLTAWFFRTLIRTYSRAGRAEECLGLFDNLVSCLTLGESFQLSLSELDELHPLVKTSPIEVQIINAIVLDEDKFIRVMIKRLERVNTKPDQELVGLDLFDFVHKNYAVVKDIIKWIDWGYQDKKFVKENIVK